MMNLFRCIIVDDEEEARNLLDDRLKKFREIEVLAKAESVDKAMIRIMEQHPDLIFLDIDMPGKNGFDLIATLDNNDINIQVIFVTAHDEFAIQAIRANAFDFITKPVDMDDLRGAVERLKARKQSNVKYAGLLQSMENRNKIQFKTQKGSVFINENNILCCQADGNYSHFKFTNNESLTVTYQLGKIISMLSSDHFFRVSRSAIINLNYLVEINRRKQCCILKHNNVEECVKCSGKGLKLLEGG